MEKPRLFYVALEVENFTTTLEIGHVFFSEKLNTYLCSHLKVLFGILRPGNQTSLKNGFTLLSFQITIQNVNVSNKIILHSLILFCRNLIMICLVVLFFENES